MRFGTKKLLVEISFMNQMIDTSLQKIETYGRICRVKTHLRNIFVQNFVIEIFCIWTPDFGDERRATHVGCYHSLQN